MNLETQNVHRAFVSTCQKTPGERVSHTRTVDNSAGSRMHAGEAGRL